MKNINLKFELENFKFEKKCCIVKVYGIEHPIFTGFERDNHEGHIYLWIVENDKKDPEKVVYVGKAGKTLRKRNSEHIGGFKGGSISGARNAEKILEILNSGKTIAVYSRYSEKTNILGVEGISLCEAEEKAMIEHYTNIGYVLFNKLG